MAIVGVGIDVVDIERFMASLERTPGLRERLFTPAEAARPPASLAARFAAKEALVKALAAPRPGWPGTTPRCESEASGRPVFDAARHRPRPRQRHGRRVGPPVPLPRRRHRLRRGRPGVLSADGSCA